MVALSETRNTKHEPRNSYPETRNPKKNYGKTRRRF